MLPLGPKKLISHFLDLCFPPACAACDAQMETAAVLCDACRAELARLVAGHACEKCARPLVAGSACPYCHNRGLAPLKNIAALAAFHPPLRALVHSAKYHRKWVLAEYLAERLHATDRGRAALTDAQVLVPIPLHWRRQFSRGYNQSRVIVAKLARLTGLPVRNAVRRIRDTGTQTALPFSRRDENVRGAFALTSPRGLVGRRILLIDDVMTSGATLRAVARALAPAKPAGISALVLAVADPRPPSGNRTDSELKACETTGERPNDRNRHAVD